MIEKFKNFPFKRRTCNTLKLHKIQSSVSTNTAGSSAGKESTCSAGVPWFKQPGQKDPLEKRGYPLQYSWAPLVAQLAKNPPATRQTWVQSLGWEDPLEKGTATHSSILVWRIHGLYSPWGHKESDMID